MGYTIPADMIDEDGEIDPDDEELVQTPQYVIDRLGFDPKELDWEEESDGEAEA